MKMYCQDFKPGAGGKPRNSGPMPANWPHPRSFKTTLRAIENGTDSRFRALGRPAPNPPPRATYVVQVSPEGEASLRHKSASIPETSQPESTPNKRPKLAHPLPPRPAGLPQRPAGHPPRPPVPAVGRPATALEERTAPPSPPPAIVTIAPAATPDPTPDIMSLDVPEPASRKHPEPEPEPEPETRLFGSRRARLQSLICDPPAPPLPQKFSRRARAALPKSREFPGKKCPIGLGRYSAMPAPTNYGEKMHSVVIDLTKPQEEDSLVEGTEWTFPPPCKDWEEAVGYERLTKAQMKAESEAIAKAFADAQEREEVDPRLPQYPRRTITVHCVDDGKDETIEMDIGGFGFREMSKYKWLPGNGLGLSGMGRLLPVSLMGNPPVDEELPADPNFMCFRPSKGKGIPTDFVTRRPGSFPFQIQDGSQAKCWDLILGKHPLPKKDEEPEQKVAEEWVPEEDEEDYGLRYLYGEEPKSQESKIRGWGQAAKNPQDLLPFRPASTAGQVSQSSEPTFQETWNRKEQGQVVEKIQSQSGSSGRQGKKLMEMTDEELNDPNIPIIDLVDDGEPIQLDANDEFDFDIDL